MWKDSELKVLATFLTEWEAMEYCDQHPNENLIVQRELSGMFQVVDMDR